MNEFHYECIVTEFLVDSPQSPFKYELPLCFEQLDEGWKQSIEIKQEKNLKEIPHFEDQTEIKELPVTSRI